jgi:micrococcal nuclease
MRTLPTFPLLIALSFGLLCLHDSAFAYDFPGHLIAILDGDRVDIANHEIEEAVRLRLFGIDAPEKDQPYWQEAKVFLGNLLTEKKVEVTLRGGFFKESDGRSVATVILPDGSTASRALVNAGLAWVYEEDFSNDQDDKLDRKEELNALEQEAREAKRGLWADPDPVPPWLYRRLRSGAYP